MDDKLAIKKVENTPIKAFQDTSKRDTAILGLGVWLDGILSLDGSKSVKRLEVLLPLIKDEAWGFSITEIKEAFMMYVKSELMYNGKVLEPIDNFLTLILFNKVMQAYRDVTRHKKLMAKTVDMDKKKIEKDRADALELFKHFKKTYQIPKDYSWVYDYLEEKIKDFTFTAMEKKFFIRMAEQQGMKDQEQIVNKSKRQLMSRYFHGLMDNNEELEDKLQTT